MNGWMDQLINQKLYHIAYSTLIIAISKLWKLCKTLVHGKKINTCMLIGYNSLGQFIAEITYIVAFVSGLPSHLHVVTYICT